MPFDPHVHVGTSALLTRESSSGLELLMVKRRDDATHGGGSWGLPGGWIDWGQTPEEATARELLEEVGVVVDPTEAVNRGAVANTYDDEQMHIVCLSYEFKNFDQSQVHNCEPHKADAVEWVPVSELASIKLFPPMRSLAELWGWL